MKLRIAATLAFAALAACSSGPPKRVHPSTASIQQLALQPDGSWRIELRVQNYSTFPMRYGTVEATMEIDGNKAGTLTAHADLEILANSGDVIEARLSGGPPLPADRDFEYQLEGTIRTSDPVESFPFKRTSRLSPVPGVADTWR